MELPVRSDTPSLPKMLTPRGKSCTRWLCLGCSERQAGDVYHCRWPHPRASSGCRWSSAVIYVTCAQSSSTTMCIAGWLGNPLKHTVTRHKNLNKGATDNRVVSSCICHLHCDLRCPELTYTRFGEIKGDICG